MNCRITLQVKAHRMAVAVKVIVPATEKTISRAVKVVPVASA